jgi:NTE family protein
MPSPPAAQCRACGRPRRSTGAGYIDGGVSSGANADCAAGASRILVILPLGYRELFPTETPLTETFEKLRAGGAKLAAIEPDEASLSAIGANPLDPATRNPAAEAGRAQGRRLEIDWGPAPA